MTADEYYLMKKPPKQHQIDFLDSEGDGDEDGDTIMQGMLLHVVYCVVHFVLFWKTQKYYIKNVYFIW